MRRREDDPTIREDDPTILGDDPTILRRREDDPTIREDDPTILRRREDDPTTPWCGAGGALMKRRREDDTTRNSKTSKTSKTKTIQIQFLNPNRNLPWVFILCSSSRLQGCLQFRLQYALRRITIRERL
jgi:hypothetical protein